MKKEGSLRLYLIKRFVILMTETAVCEILLNSLYNKVVFPYLQKTLYVDVFSKGEGIVGAIFNIIMTLFFLLIDNTVKNDIPFLYSFLDAKGFTHSVIPVSARYGGLPTLYYIGIFFILFALLIMLLTPYIITVIVFIKIIIARVDRPIRKMTGAMNVVGDGDFSVRLDFETEYEFVIMRDTFNIMAENIEESRRKNAEYEKQRNLLFADIAHDLKTPITTIAGYSKAIYDGIVESEEKKQEYLNAIHEKSQRMDELVKMLFEYAKLSDSHYRLHFERMDVAEILREIIAGVYTDFEEKGINLEILIDDDCVYADVDKLQFTRAVMNIVNNSIKHNASGNTVLVELKAEENIVINIADDGEVIEPELAKNIFEPFTVGDESRNSRNGSGLGLSIAHKIVSMHGGSLELVDFTENGYTKSFTIVIPKNN